MDEAKRVLFVNRSYWPDAEATGQLLTELCEDLGESEQLDVSVVCGQPNFNLDNVEFERKGIQERNGIAIHRVTHSQFDKSTFHGRIINFITFLLAAFWRTLWIKKPALMIVQTDPPLLCLLGYIVSRLRGIKFVCYLQDVYPDIAVELGRLKENLLTKILRRSFLHAYRNADQVIVVGSDMKNWLVNHRVPADKIRIIENWVDTNQIQPIKSNNQFRHKYDLEDKFVVMYSGNLGYTQRFDLVLDAAEALQENRDIVFAFVGNGVKRMYLCEETIKRRLPNIRFMDYQPKSELSQSLSAADVHLVLLDAKLTPYMLPSKIYSALASGTPVLGLGADKTPIGKEYSTSHLAGIIADDEAGIFVDESNAGQLANSISWFYENQEQRQDMGQRARIAAESNHNRSVALNQFFDLLVESGTCSGVSPNAEFADQTASVNGISIERPAKALSN